MATSFFQISMIFMIVGICKLFGIIEAEFGYVCVLLFVVIYRCISSLSVIMYNMSLPLNSSSTNAQNCMNQHYRLQSCSDLPYSDTEIYSQCKFYVLCFVTLVIFCLCSVTYFFHFCIVLLRFL